MVTDVQAGRDAAVELLERAVAGDQGAFEIDANSAKRIHQVVVFGSRRDAQLRKVLDPQALRAPLRGLFTHNRSLKTASFLLNAYLHCVFAARSHWVETAGETWSLNGEAESELLNVCMEDERERGQRPANQVGLASISHINHDHNACAEFLKRSIQAQTDEDDLRTYQGGAHTYLPPLDLNFELVGDYEPEMDGLHIHQLPDLAASNPVIVAVMDGGYLQRFAAELAGSLAAFGRQSLHFHVINPRDEDETLVGQLRDQNPRLSIGFTSEANDRRLKPYYATCRMIRAHWLLETIGHDIVIHDADITFQQDPANIYAGWEEFDASFIKRRGFPAHVPWRTVTAQAIHFRNNSHGRAAARMLSQTSGHMFERFEHLGDTMWWIDQNALHFTYEYLRRGPTKLGQIPTHILRAINHAPKKN